MSRKFEYIGTMDEGLALSDRLVTLLGPDIVLTLCAAVSKASAEGGLEAGVKRLQQAARELTEIRQLAEASKTEQAGAGLPSFADLAKLLQDVAPVDPAALLVDGLTRTFSPAMTAWKRDVLALVEVDGKPVREAGLPVHDLNEIVVAVVRQKGFFPWRLG